MNKRFAIVIAFVVLVSVVAIGASSYYSTLVEMQQYRPNVSQQSMSINLANGSPALGSLSAPVTIVEFGDYQCEMCYHWFHNTRADVIDNYIETGKAKLVFLDLPFLGRDSIIAAQATYCAEDQGKYWEYHTLLYNFQEEIDNGWASKDRLIAFAFNLDMDVAEFTSCMDVTKYGKRVKANYDEAVNQGAQATPTFILISPNGDTKKISGAQPYPVFSKIIESML
jgi:protein-disulfide isomerase